ncbi:MAG: YdgA family protein [Symploca sp. SIO2G7]|nr:YdgA family protein [Symploca sp. SIO2G7]
MKKFFLGLLFVLALIALGLPGLIAAWLPGQIEQSLDEHWPEATLVVERGWFNTTAIAQQGRTQLKLECHHLRWWRGTLLDANGNLMLSEPQTNIEIDARFNLDTTLHIHAHSERVEWAGTGTNRIDAPTFTLELNGSGEGKLVASARRLNLADILANELALAEIQVESNWRGSDERLDQVRLNIQTERAAQPLSQLNLTAASIDREALAQLNMAWSELQNAPPDSLQAQMAGLGLISAWQQLVQAGLVLELETLNLDREVSISGRWQPDQNMLGLQGGGRTPAALDWISPMLGLSQQLPAEKARAKAWQWIQQAADNDYLRLDGEQFEINDAAIN